MSNNFLSNSVEFFYNLADLLHSKRIFRFYGTKKIDAVIDVGSHKGEFIRQIVRNKKIPIFSFEPQEKIKNTLVENTKDYNVVEYFNFALSDESATKTLYLSNLSSTSSLNLSNSDRKWIKIKKFLLGGNLYTGKQEIECFKMDDILLNRINCYSSILLKIDVEGAEEEVLRGSRKILETKKVRFVQIESANFDIYQDSDRKMAHQILLDHEYRPVRKFVFPLLNFTDVVYERS